MKAISIFNDVLGPVMRGPSSSHTAGSFHIELSTLFVLTFQRAGHTIALLESADPSNRFREVEASNGTHPGCSTLARVAPCREPARAIRTP
jgi:L-serine deaminase